MRNPNAKVSDPNEFVSNPGEQFKIEYSSKVLPDGRIEIVASGKIDIKQMINSQRECTDMAYIIRAMQNGDSSMLNENGFYGDMTAFPKTFAEVLQLQIDAKKSFDDLTVEQKKAFDNDFNQYFATAGTEDWAKKLGYVKEEVKEDTPDVEA